MTDSVNPWTRLEIMDSRRTTRGSLRPGAASRSPIVCGRSRPAAGDRRHDGHLVPLLERGLLALEEPDVLLVDVDVDEAADLTALLHEAVPHAGILTLQISDQVGDGVGRHLDLGRALGHRPQGGGNAHENSHPESPCITGPGFEVGPCPRVSA